MRKIILLLFICHLGFGSFAQDFSLKQLEQSPRHHEWVRVKSGVREVHCFVTYPEKAQKATAVIVIHENRGLTDWVRSFTDQLAAEGYLAIAPDLLSSTVPGKERTGSFENQDAARDAIYQLKPEQVTADLNAVQAYVAKLPSANGKTAVIGFCWGGGQSFRLATTNPDLEAALVFYGSSPESPEDIQQITAPVYGFYGENDLRINAGIEPTAEKMKAAGKTYNYKIYAGAGHAYMRAGDDPAGSPENKKARDDSWARIRQILTKL